MRTCIAELRAQQNHASPPGPKRMTEYHTLQQNRRDCFNDDEADEQL